MPTLIHEIEAQIAQAKTTPTRRNVGVIREIGDGVAKVDGLTDVMLNEMLDLGHGITGLALNLEETEVGVIVLGDYTELEEGDEVLRHGQALAGARGQGPAGTCREYVGRAAGWQRPHPKRRHLSGREGRSGNHPPRIGHPAGANGDHADRRDDSDRPRPARADYWRPFDGQDHNLYRHHHQPGAAEQGGGSRR